MAEKHPKRPRDLNQWAKRMVDIATGEVQDRSGEMTVKRASKAGQKGGPARARALTPEKRAEIAREASEVAAQRILDQARRVFGRDKDQWLTMTI
jgi:hypothetical protein